MNIVNSKLYYFLEKMTNFFLLNLIWLLFSLPIITLFPATAAMYAVIRDWVQGKDSGVIQPFFQYFKVNFKHSFAYGILWGICLFIFYIDLAIIAEFESTANLLMTSLLFVIGLLVAFNTAFIIPVMVHFKLSFWGHIKHAFLFSIMYFPTTLLCLFIIVGMVILVLYLPALLFVIFSIGSYVVFRLCYRTFEKVGKV
ncbi:YesL family protein [Halalkalibacter sp. AB-rgal2]|uniref:YesL family protein n=1 Tax=Halalkalibacter sp. AB-rgal2 TaxID=3242695 RepID=UPI00359EDDB5|nr:DUF624 domain-containing protein [Halalkalibacter sp. APA_J-10(15)]